MKQVEQWMKDVAALTVIYLMLERGKKLSVLLEGEDVGLDPLLNEMFAHDLVALEDKTHAWVVTEKGKALRKQMLGMYDLLQQYKVFGRTNLTRLSPEAEDPQNPGQVRGSWPDPRFEALPDSWDLRLCMMDFAGDGKFDLRMVVFMQKLIDGELDGPDFWPNMLMGLRPEALLPPDKRPPTTFEDIDTIVANAYYWRNAANDEATARAETMTLYTAGLLEQRKRDGASCSSCGGYLAVYELEAQRFGETFDKCPCGASFAPPTPEIVDEKCPNCRSAIGPGQSRCDGCGASINRAMAEGAVSTTNSTETVAETVAEPVWGNDYGYYGYTPMVYLDPWSIAVDVALFSMFCPVIW